MKCVEAKRMVTRFVNRELSYQELEQFLHHVENCRDCMEELDIYFTMYKAFDMMDEGGRQEYDFKKMLNDELHAARRAILVHRLLMGLGTVLLVCLGLLVVFSVYYGFFRH